MVRIRLICRYCWRHGCSLSIWLRKNRMVCGRFLYLCIQWHGIYSACCNVDILCIEQPLHIMSVKGSSLKLIKSQIHSYSFCYFFICRIYSFSTRVYAKHSSQKKTGSRRASVIDDISTLFLMLAIHDRSSLSCSWTLQTLPLSLSSLQALWALLWHRRSEYHLHCLLTRKACNVSQLVSFHWNLNLWCVFCNI